MTLKPFWTYYGGKYRAAPRYPEPKYETLIEPFSGSAGYALRYPNRNVILIDKDEIVCGLWKYLIKVSPEEILSLPDIHGGQTVDDFPELPQEARWLIGFWLNKGAASPCKSPSAWMRSGIRPHSYWGQKIRQRIAAQVEAIRHWKVQPGDYKDIQDIEATWFVDPPYQIAGSHYRCNSQGIDFQHLGTWCQSRKGQVIVCENEGADWLPFRVLGNIKANPSKTGGKSSAEVIWTNSDQKSDDFMSMFT